MIIDKEQIMNRMNNIGNNAYNQINNNYNNSFLGANKYCDQSTPYYSPDLCNHYNDKAQEMGYTAGAIGSTVIVPTAMNMSQQQ